MQQIQLLVTADGERVPLIDPPPNFVPGENEYIITEPISEEAFAQLTDPNAEQFRCYRFMPAYTGSPYDAPDMVNYRHLPLHKHKILNRGLRIEWDGFGQYDRILDTYGDLVVRELHYYEWYPGRSIPRYREKRIQFMLENGEVGYEKIMPDYFTIDEGSKLHQKRKAANLGALNETLLGLFIREAGYAEGYARVTGMFTDVLLAVQTYEKAQEGPLIEAMGSYPEEILDRLMSPFVGAPTIREYIIDQLTINEQN